MSVEVVLVFSFISVCWLLAASQKAEEFSKNLDSLPLRWAIKNV